MLCFRCPAKWFSYSYTYIYSSDSFPLYFIPFYITEYWVEFPVPISRSLLIICFIYNSVYTLISWIFNKKTDLPWRRGSFASRLNLDLSCNSSQGLQAASPPCRFSVYQAPMSCCDSWGHKESDMTKHLIWSDLIYSYVSLFLKTSLSLHTQNTHYTSFWSCFSGEPILLRQGVMLGFLCALPAWAGETKVRAGWT